MTLDEAIKHAEEVAERCEFDTDWGIGNHFIDRSGVADVIECGKEHRHLAEWLRKYQKIENIVDDCDLEAWEVLEMIKEVVKE
jgi:hypothetical protein